MRASIYTRISADREGAGLGVQTQEADCRELAATLGAEVSVVHTDNDLSAYSGKPRPGYRDLLAAIERGEVDVVLAWHTDRLHRSPSELEAYILACERHSVTTHTVKAGQLDLTTASGLYMARNLGALARFEVDHARERMHRAKLRSAESGRWKGGRRPFGYEADGVTLREAEADLIRTAADAILAGASVRSIARTWNEQGSTTTTGQQWSPNAPRRVLLRPRNAGLMEHRGEVIGEAEWPAILAPEKWRAVQRILTDPDRRTNSASGSGVRSLGSGLFRCGTCGHPVRTDRDRQGNRNYRCREGSHVTRLTAAVDEFVSAILVERLRRSDLRDLLLDDQREDVSGLERRVIEVTARKTQLAGLFAEGAIDAQQLSVGSRRLDADLTAARDRIASAYSSSALAGIGNAPDPGDAWLAADLERQRLVLDALAEVTLQPSGRGRPAGWRAGESYFRPDSVDVRWR